MKYKSEKDVNNSDHPARKLAIRIIEEAIEPFWKPLRGKVYYDVEDAVTIIISEKIK